ncbi:MAG: cation transporter [Smithellaceae bacterium]|nr:cation transporter [Smithellaceae bacterium]
MKTLKIEGMSCNHCVMAVTKALSGVAGVKDIKIDLQKGEATFEEEKPVDMAALKAAVEKAGYRIAGS